MSEGRGDVTGRIWRSAQNPQLVRVASWFYSRGDGGGTSHECAKATRILYNSVTAHVRRLVLADTLKETDDRRRVRGRRATSTVYRFSGDEGAVLWPLPAVKTTSKRRIVSRTDDAALAVARAFLTGCERARSRDELDRVFAEMATAMAEIASPLIRVLRVAS